MDVFDDTKAFTEFWSAQRWALMQTPRSLRAKLGTSAYEELALPGGHVGVFVGGKPQKPSAPTAATFLQ